MASCPYCKAQVPSPVAHGTECPSCRRILHCCRLCTFYSPDAHYGCRESIDEPVWDKEKDNFCDFFRLTDKGVSGGKDSDEEKKKARARLDSLFSF